MKLKFYTVCVMAAFALICRGETTNVTAIRDSSVSFAFPFSDKHDLNSDNIHASTILTVENPVLKNADNISIKVRFINSGKSADFYNLFMNGRIPLPAQLAVYDDKHNYLFAIMPWTSSVIEEGWDDWTYFPGGGCLVEFPLTYGPRSWRLQAGDYYVQLIYYKAFIALNPPWRETDPDVKAKQARLRDFTSHFDRTELFRSNPVKITVTN